MASRKKVPTKVTFDTALTSVCRKTILAVAARTNQAVRSVLLKMFRASCANASGSGAGCGRKGQANLYTTQHALPHIGAYVLIHDCDDLKILKEDCACRVFQFGSKVGYCLGTLIWDNQMHHARPDWMHAAQNHIHLPSIRDFAPWELGFVGTVTEQSNHSEMD